MNNARITLFAALAAFAPAQLFAIPSLPCRPKVFAPRENLLVDSLRLEVCLPIS